MRGDYMALPDGVTLLEAFPFDSSPNLVYTDQGYPRGDRSVDSWTMQRAFRQFFSSGVFGTPPDAWQISKGPSGLTVTINPGMAVIEGAMGGIKESDGPITITLDGQAAQGNVCYGIMLRYDNNVDMRGMGIRVVKGEAGSEPKPPEPDTTSEGVYELRLGYVTVPNGVSEVSEAAITNEKGTAVCPYAAPFAEIDMSQVTADARATAIAALDSLMAYFDQYRDMVDAAVDETLAGQLQEQINQLKGQLDNFDLSSSVDGNTIEYSRASGETEKTLKIIGLPDGWVTDSAESHGTASQHSIASPACVDAKMAARFDQRVEQNTTDSYKLTGSVDFSNATYFTVTGFEKSETYIKATAPLIASVLINYRNRSASAVYLKVNGSTVAELGSGVSDIPVTNFLLLTLDAGDRVSIESDGSVSIYNLTIQGA